MAEDENGSYPAEYSATGIIDGSQFFNLNQSTTGGLNPFGGWVGENPPNFYYEPTDGPPYASGVLYAPTKDTETSGLKARFLMNFSTPFGMEPGTVLRIFFAGDGDGNALNYPITAGFNLSPSDDTGGDPTYEMDSGSPQGAPFVFNSQNAPMAAPSIAISNGLVSFTWSESIAGNSRIQLWVEVDLSDFTWKVNPKTWDYGDNGATERRHQVLSFNASASAEMTYKVLGSKSVSTTALSAFSQLGSILTPDANAQLSSSLKQCT